jgi:hypothetical protein
MATGCTCNYRFYNLIINEYILRAVTMRVQALMKAQLASPTFSPLYAGTRHQKPPRSHTPAPRSQSHLRCIPFACCQNARAYHLQAIMKAQLASPTFSPLYAALIT